MNQRIQRIYNDDEDFPIGIFSQTNYIADPHHHIEYEIFYLEKGTANVILDNTDFILNSGDAIFISPGFTHSISNLNQNEEFHYYALAFDSSVIGREGNKIRKIFDSIRISSNIKLSDNLKQNIKQAADAEKKNVFGKEIFEKALLLDIISYLIQTKQYINISDSISSTSSHRISAIDVSLKYIHEHYRELITMDDLLKITSYSKSHFIRLFKKNTGMNLTDYINKYRIEKSCLDLIYTNKNITEIATENGFNTVQYFSKIFKEHMNCTPKKYQKEGRNIVIPSSIANTMDN